MKKHISPLIWLMLAVSLIGALLLLIPRFSSEQADRDCSIVMFREDVQMLAEANGISETSFINSLGAGTVYIIEDDGMGYAPDGTAVFAGSATKEQYDRKAKKNVLMPIDGEAQYELPQLLVENIYRSDMLAPADYDAESYTGDSVRALYLFPFYRNRVVEADPADVTNVLFLGATDRGLRLLILRPYSDKDGNLCTDIDTYTSSINDLRTRLESRGLTLGKTFSVMEANPRQPILLACAGLAPALAAVWLLCRLSFMRRWMNILLGLSIAADFAVCLLMPAFAQKGLMLASALFIPCTAIYYLTEFTAAPPTLPQERSFILRTIALLAAIVGTGLLSGLAVSSLMASRSYLLSTEIFSGVKLALLAPLAFAFVLLLKVLGKRLRPTNKRGWMILAGFGLFMLIIVLGLLMRSGDASSVSEIESAIRSWLERTLYARPRTKELLLGAPCIPLFIWARDRQYAPLQLVCGMGCSLEIVSVCNTFCHAVTPLRVSVIRTLLGAGLGFLLGLCACALLYLLFSRTNGTAPKADTL